MPCFIEIPVLRFALLPYYQRIVSFSRKVFLQLWLYKTASVQKLTLSDCCQNCSFSKFIIDPFSTNVTLIDKPGSSFLLGKCLKNTFARVTF